MRYSSIFFLCFSFAFGALMFSCKNISPEQINAKSTPATLPTVKDHTMTPPKNADQKQFDINYIMGKFDPASHKDFMAVPEKYADQPDRLLRKDVFEAFLKMWEAAQKDGITLKIVSATRNFDYQKGIWERKWNGQTLLEGNVNATNIINPKNRALKILEYSSMPGTSRHHWGTDIDLNELNNAWFDKGEGRNIYNWLSKNALNFGFVQVYTPKNGQRPNGYNEERWHWSYKPISSLLLESAKVNLKNYMIAGFNGSETASDIDVVNNYVLGVNPECFAGQN